MTYDIVELQRRVERLSNENMRFREFLKEGDFDIKEVDALVFEISTEVWKDVDCTKCGNCCRAVSTIVSELDLTRLAGGCGMTASGFAEKYLRAADKEEAAYNEAPWLIRDQPCPFLNENKCTVYEHRPDGCRAYPYLEKPDLVHRALSMMGRLDVCPAAFELWERLKSKTGFRRDRP